MTDYMPNHENQNLKLNIIRELLNTARNFKIIQIINVIVWLILTAITVIFSLQLAGKIETIIKVQQINYYVVFSLTAIDTIIFIYLIWANIKFNQERKLHFKDKDSVDIHRIPNFIINKYKNLTIVTIIWNWLTFLSLIVGGVVFATLLVVNGKEEVPIEIGDGIKFIITKTGGFHIKNSIIIGLGIYLVVVILIAISGNLWVSWKKNYLNNLFDLTQRVPHEKLNSYKKWVNLFCALIFLLPLIICYFIYRIVRKSKRK